MKRLPPLGSIQAFIQVARLGSLKAAADSMALSPPALTRRVQALEQFIGHSLFERHRNGVLVNARGEAFLNAIGPHIDALAGAIDRATDDGHTLRVRIAVPSLFGSQRLMPALPSLRRRHPQLMIDLDTGIDRASRLGEDIDAAIAIGATVHDRLYSRLLERGRIVAIGSRTLLAAQPALRDPAGLGSATVLLHRDLPGAFDEWKKAAGYPDLQPANVNYFDSGQLILDAAAAGLGVAFMFRTHLDSSDDPRLVQIFEQTAESPYAYWFACPPASLERRGIRIFHDWLFEYFGQAGLAERPAAA